MRVSINKRLVCTVYPKFVSVNMIFFCRSDPGVQ